MNRRNFLRTTGGTAAVIATGGLAGCLDIFGDSGSVRFETDAGFDRIADADNGELVTVTTLSEETDGDDENSSLSLVDTTTNERTAVRFTVSVEDDFGSDPVADGTETVTTDDVDLADADLAPHAFVSYTVTVRGDGHDDIETVSGTMSLAGGETHNLEYNIGADIDTIEHVVVTLNATSHGGVRGW